MRQGRESVAAVPSALCEPVYPTKVPRKAASAPVLVGILDIAFVLQMIPMCRAAGDALDSDSGRCRTRHPVASDSD